MKKKSIYDLLDNAYNEAMGVHDSLFSSIFGCDVEDMNDERVEPKHDIVIERKNDRGTSIRIEVDLGDMSSETDFVQFIDKVAEDLYNELYNRMPKNNPEKKSVDKEEPEYYVGSGYVNRENNEKKEKNDNVEKEEKKEECSCSKSSCSCTKKIDPNNYFYKITYKKSYMR